MATVLKLTGVDELLEALARLAPDLAGQAATLERAIAEETAETLRATYPAVTGALRASVAVQREASRSPVRVFTTLAVTAPYAEFYEFGTFRTTPHPTFVPITRRGREAFARAVIARVRDQGLRVTGDVS